MDNQKLIERYSNKQVSFSFDGTHTEYHLSQGLFSSYDIDAGTRLLLKCVAKHVDVENVRSVLDMGCGVGVIGVSIAKRNPEALCVLQDRDALAVRFARANCVSNGVEENTRVVRGLAFQGLTEDLYDLILSNLPAKAGEPVLRHMVQAALRHARPEGYVGIVVVTPLTELLGAMIPEEGGLIIHREESREHCVYLFKAGELSGAYSPGIDPYVRHNGDFHYKTRSYRLKTAYNLPSFDTLGRDLVLAYGLVERFLSNPSQIHRVLIWNPGQGHFPVYLSTLWSRSTDFELHLASRDALQLAISEMNVSAVAPGISIKKSHVAEIGELIEQIRGLEFSLIALFPAPIPGVKWQDSAAALVDVHLKRGGFLLSSTTSTEIHRLQQSLKRVAVMGHKKDRGSRAILLKKH